MASNEGFRDKLETIEEDGKRKWVYALLPNGRLTRWRHGLAWFLLALFFILPHIRINSVPFLLLNIADREFILFGMIFWPQDTYLLGIAMVTFMVFVILFTIVWGRVWCGWVCPQTIFMEIIFRRIETWIDGKPDEQRKLREAEWTSSKIFKRSFKFLVFFILIFLIVNTFLSYFLGTEGLANAYHLSFKNYPVTAFLLVFGTTMGMFIYGWFREQTCTVICPYGRLQGAMVDNDTMVIAYDYKRGEPRGKSQDGIPAGDCIDCGNCVKVCPTGIDIRNGTQLECINCTACIDACNHVMQTLKRPSGLIRFSTEKGIEDHQRLTFTPRIILYSAVLLSLFAFLTFLIMNRNVVETTVLRTPGFLYQIQDDGRISNLYNIRLVNKSREDISLDIKPLDLEGEIKIPGNILAVNAGSSAEYIVFLMVDPKNITRTSTKVKFGFYKDNQLIESFSTTFMGPIKEKNDSK